MTAAHARGHYGLRHRARSNAKAVFLSLVKLDLVRVCAQAEADTARLEALTRPTQSLLHSSIRRRRGQLCRHDARPSATAGVRSPGNWREGMGLPDWAWVFTLGLLGAFAFQSRRRVVIVVVVHSDGTFCPPCPLLGPPTRERRTAGAVTLLQPSAGAAVAAIVVLLLRIHEATC